MNIDWIAPGPIVPDPSGAGGVRAQKARVAYRIVVTPPGRAAPPA